MKAKISLSCLLALSTIFTSAQTAEYRLRHITNRDGLTNSSVNLIYTDHSGRVWFGTWDGLGRYEGIERSAYNAFMGLPRASFSDVFLFWDDFVAQGALTAFLGRGIKMPEDVKVVALSNRGLGPVYPETLTRFECDAAATGEKIADFTLAMLARGRVPPPPVIAPQYVFGTTFPY